MIPLYYNYIICNLVSLEQRAKKMWTSASSSPIGAARAPAIICTAHSSASVTTTSTAVRRATSRILASRITIAKTAPPACRCATMFKTTLALAPRTLEGIDVEW